MGTDRDDTRLVAAGALGAVALGAALIPLRAVTPAGNLTFPFLLLTIAIAELGGTLPVVATALMSAFSLDFFLTQPYLTFAITDKHDALAFTGLTVCGLTVAGFRSWRSRRVPPPSEEALHLDLLRTVLEELGSGASRQAALAACLREVRQALPLRALAVRDAGDAVLAAEGDTRGEATPGVVLETQTFHVKDERGPSILGPSLPLPPTGARLPLQFEDRRVGWLEVWGDGAPASAETRRTLLDVARLLSAALR